MLEFVFFHPQPLQDFIAFLATHGITADSSQDDDIWQVALPDDIDDRLYENIEQEYQRLMEVSQQLADSEENPPDDYHKAGVVLNLQNGQTVYADVDPALLAKIMQVLTPQQFGDVVNAIVDAV
ncbi:MAG: hypothetical protein PVG66_06775 [Chromatiales bacterium]|jgi:hypothetical protein